MHSALAQRARGGELSGEEVNAVMRRFLDDLRKRRFRVVALKVRHYEIAEVLIDRYGRTHGLRTLDSLHLALALDLHADALVDSMVAADKVLCGVARIEGPASTLVHARSLSQCFVARLDVRRLKAATIDYSVERFGTIRHRAWLSGRVCHSKRGPTPAGNVRESPPP